MSTKKIYGPWIKWDGGECPVPPDTLVEVKFRDGSCETGHSANCYSWLRVDFNDDIVEYRIAIEQPDLEAAEKLLRENGYTVTPPAKPLTFEDVEPITEAPPEGTEYWVIRPLVENGVTQLYWDNDDIDKTALRQRMAYLEKEHALIAARHIFGLKGGEL